MNELVELSLAKNTKVFLGCLVVLRIVEKQIGHALRAVARGEGNNRWTPNCATKKTRSKVIARRSAHIAEFFFKFLPRRY